MQNAVIFHHPDSVNTDRERLMGRHAAGEGFLTGFIRHSGAETFYAETRSADHFLDFTGRVKALGDPGRKCRRVSPAEYGDPDVPAMLMMPGPDYADLAWRRRQLSQSATFGICGVNHTVASPNVMDGLAAMARAPVNPWDALICTSEASRSAIRHVIDAEFAYLEERFGAKPSFAAEMPVIPLGVDCERFSDSRRSEAERAHLRRGIGIGESDVALLFLGRLSFHAKAHPLPMYLAAEEAAHRTGRRVHLIMAGWFANDAIEREFRESARQFCPSVRMVFLDGRDRDVRQRIWHAADIFISLSDNIQETFGLTPIEAMAAGLPVIVSDWDGYRETVRDGVDGFLVPSWMPGSGRGGDLALDADHDFAGTPSPKTYDRYCGEVSQAIAVDTAACIDALSLLITEPEKRAKLGQAGRRRAREVYDWRHIVSAYQDLWAELDERRRRAQASTRDDQPTMVPTRPDPFAMFAAYPSDTVSEETFLKGGEHNDRAAIDQRLRHSMNSFARGRLLPMDDLETILAIVADTGGLSTAGLERKMPGRNADALAFSVAWLGKMDLLRLVDETTGRGSRDDADARMRAAAGLHDAEADAAVTVPESVDRTRQSAPPDDDGGPEGSDPSHSLIRIKRRVAEAKTAGDMEAAEKYLQRAAAIAPDDPAVNAQMGELMALRGRFDKAVDLLRHSIDSRPDDVPTLRQLGKALFLAGNEPEAVHAFRRAVRIAPDDGESRLLLGIALRRSGAFNEAVRCLRVATEIDPENARPLYYLGLACESLGHFDEAARCFGDASRIDPADRLIEAAILSAEAAALCRGRDLDRLPRVLFHLSAPGDFNAFRPVFHALGDACWPLLSGDARQIAEFAPALGVTCGAGADDIRSMVLDETCIHLCAAAARDTAGLAAAVTADMVCALNDGDRDALIEGGHDRHRIAVTGTPISDVLFRDRARSRPSPLMPNRRYVLFAPHAAATSAAAQLGDFFSSAISALPDDTDIAILPHPDTLQGQPLWMENWRRMAGGNDRIVLLDRPDASPAEMAAAADAMITDPGDKAALYLALDRPLIVTGKRHKGAHALNETVVAAIEQAASAVHEPAALGDALAQAMANPDAMSEPRARARSIVFGDTGDGGSATRIAEAILERSKA